MTGANEASVASKHGGEGLTAARHRARGAVVDQTLRALQSDDLTALLELLDEARHIEGARPSATSPHPLSLRWLRDRRTQQLLRSRPQTLDQARAKLRHLVEAYVDEIGCRFDARVYRAIIAFGRWAFNALSHLGEGHVATPWALPDILPSRITICGEVEQLQRLVRSNSVMLVPTHQSHNDILLFGHVLDRLELPPFAWAAGLNLFRNPLLGTVLSLAGGYSVDRQRPSTVYRTTLRCYCTHLLAHATSTLVFAGGGRSRSGAIESELRHGLLGSALEAQRELTRVRSQRRVYLVPVTVSYHQVLEAPWLTDQYLSSLGIARPARRQGPTLRDAWQFHRSAFRQERSATVRFGPAVDLDGDDAPASENGLPARDGAVAGADSLLQVESIGRTICDRLHRNAVVLPSQLVACAAFESIRAGNSDAKLRELLAEPDVTVSITRAEMRLSAEMLSGELRALERRGAVHLSPEFDAPTDSWLGYGISRLSEFHGRSLLEALDDRVTTSDLGLLFYYRNRLRGYGLHGPAAPSESPVSSL